MQPRVIDIFHGNQVASDGFQKAASLGIWGVIHKASQGFSMKDSKYAERRKMALDAGLLWGAYHFNSGDTVKSQVDNFLSAARPDDKTLLCLDYEDYKSMMTIDQVVEFCELVEHQTNKPVVIYSGNTLKENISRLKPVDFAYITKKRLWLCQYSSEPKLPKGFDKYWLWQYTGDGNGPEPHSLVGFNNDGPVDLNVYQGTKQQLTDDWYRLFKGFVI